MRADKKEKTGKNSRAYNGKVFEYRAEQDVS